MIVLLFEANQRLTHTDSTFRSTRNLTANGWNLAWFEGFVD